MNKLANIIYPKYDHQYWVEQVHVIENSACLSERLKLKEVEEESITTIIKVHPPNGSGEKLYMAMIFNDITKAAIATKNASWLVGAKARPEMVCWEAFVVSYGSYPSGAGFSDTPCEAHNFARASILREKELVK